MRKLLYGSDYHNRKRQSKTEKSESLPLIISRSKKTNVQQQQQHYGANANANHSSNNNNNMSLSSLPLLLDTNDDGDGESYSSSSTCCKNNNNNNNNNADGDYTSVTISTTTTTETILSDGSIVFSSSTNANTNNGATKDNYCYNADATTATTTTTTTTTTAHRQWLLLRGRFVLFLLAIVYGSLNISMRLVFGRPDPPTASASSTIQGWFAVICFLPLLNLREIICNNNSNSTNNSNSNKARGILTTLAARSTRRINSSNKQQHHQHSKLKLLSFSRFALELALFNFGTQALINISLVATPGARASFLVQMSVVFTPIVTVLFGRQKIGKRVWIACFVALTGLFVLSFDNDTDTDTDTDNNNNNNTDHNSIINDNPNNNNKYYYNYSSISLSFTWGDWCCLGAACCWSFYIYRMSAWGDYFDETTTQFVKNSVLAVLYTLWMLISSLSHHYYFHPANDDNGSESESAYLWKGWRDPIAWLILFYTALGPCTIADICQQKAQASVPAAETNVILSLEPVFTTLLGFVVLGEKPSLQELCGGVLIMIASIIASCQPSSR